MLQFRRIVVSVVSALALAAPVYAGKLAIVIDDFGYRPHYENQVLAMPSAISVAVLPNAPHAHEMATKAHNGGHQVLIHLPMAPQQAAAGKDTLRPDMSSDEIDRIIRDAYNKVPYAVGLNNHMGSAMTSSLYGMLKVMQALERYNLYFLDSMTIGNSRDACRSGNGRESHQAQSILDDSQNEADIRMQFNRAVQLARRNGSAIAIGHPHPSTVRVLQQMLPGLPADITLVRPSDLLNEPQVDTSRPGSAQPPATQPRNPFRGVKNCTLKQPPEPVYATRFFTVIGESISSSTLVKYVQQQWQGWGKA